MSQKMYRTQGSISPVHSASTNMSTSAQNDESFEHKMETLINQHLQKVSALGKLISQEKEEPDSNKGESATEEKKTVGTKENQENKVGVAESLYTVLQTQNNVQITPDTENEERVIGDDNLHRLIAMKERTVEEENGRMQREAAHEKLRKNNGTEASTLKPRLNKKYKIIRCDEFGNESTVMINVTTEDGEIEDKEAQIIALDTVKQMEENSEKLEENARIALLALDNSCETEELSFQQTTDENTEKKHGALWHIKKTFSPKKKSPIAQEEQEPEQGIWNRLKKNLKKSPSQVEATTSEVHMSPTKKFMNAISSLKSSVSDAKEVEEKVQRQDLSQVGAFVSKRMHTAYYTDDNVYNWSYGGYEKVIEIRETRDRASVPYIAAQSKKDGGKIYTSDKSGKCIRIYTSNGTYLHMLSCKKEPLSIETYQNDKLLCAHPENHCIDLIDMIVSKQVQSTSHRSLKKPRGIAINSLRDGAVAVTDVEKLNKCSIKIFDIKSGKLAQAIALKTHSEVEKAGWCEFITYGTDDNNYLYTVDSWKQKVMVYDVRYPDTTVLEFGEKGSEQGEFSNPTGIGYLPTGGVCDVPSIVIADWYNDRISCHDAKTGEFLRYLMVDQDMGPSPVLSPYDLKVKYRAVINNSFFYYVYRC
ncbi:uncharacterized protein LOC100181372 isoform X3 [Ciona intestinalis]